MSRETYELNGLTKTQPRGAKYHTKKTPTKAYLESIKRRLDDEVGIIVEAINERNGREPLVGFFSMVRIIMPIVETVASSEGKTPQQLLVELGVSYPHLTWNVYRDIFLHNDEFAIAAVGKAAVQSGIYFTNDDSEEGGKLLAKDGRMCDPMQIRRHLLGYLSARIASLPDGETTDIIEVIEYDPSSTEPEIKGAVTEIKKAWDDAVAH